MTDIVNRLRNMTILNDGWIDTTINEAADEIERLRADRDRWMQWGTHVFVCPNKGLNPCEECVAPNTRDAMNRYDKGGAW